MSNLKISIITSGDYPYGGATENFVREMVLGMHESGNTPEVIRYRGSRYNNKNDTSVEVRNLLFKKPRKGDLFNILEQIIIYLYLPIFIGTRKIKYHDECFILYGLDFSPMTAPFRFWTRIFGIKCYRIVTDYYNDDVIASAWWKKIKHLFYRNQFKRIDKKMDGIIVVSNFLYELEVKSGVEKYRVKKIPHFIKISDCLSSIPNENSYYKICYAGTLTYENGIYDLIEAFKIVSEKNKLLELTLVGKVDKKLKLFLEKPEINDLRIETMGFMKKDEVYKKYLESNLLINPRISGTRADAGFPTKLGEYFSCGKPVITTNVGDIGDYLEDKVNVILADPCSPRSLADAIEYAYNNPDKALRIAAKGKQWAKGALDYRRNAKKLLDFIYSSRSRY